jgi:hypothetical protein
MKKIDLSNYGLSELSSIDLQMTSGGSRLSEWVGAIAHHVWNFIDCDSESEAKRNETLMNCI